MQVNSSPSAGPQQDLVSLLQQARVLPLVTLRCKADTQLLGEILQAAAYPAIEVLLRDPFSWLAIEQLRHGWPDLKVGVGTVKTQSELLRAKQLELAFAVSPGFMRELSIGAEDLGLAYLSGFSTASELMQIEARGALCAKLFPAAALGPAYLAQLMPAFPTMHVLPSGGLNATLAAEMSCHQQVPCVSGSWMLPRTWSRGLLDDHAYLEGLRRLRLGSAS